MSIPRTRDGSAAVDFDDKIAFLRRPDSYPEATADVELIGTHMSCVFLIDRHAYKLKKPVRYSFLDFSTLDLRHRDCREEVRLNRRLAAEVYLGVVALNQNQSGELQLGGAGAPVDWLVKMRRLPRRLMLDEAIRRAEVVPEQVRRVGRILTDFYLRAAPVAMEPATFRQRIVRDVHANRKELCDPSYGIARDTASAVISAQLAVLDRRADTFEQRVRDRRVVEGHGDLRPEHVCLADAPVIIDCLEFNRDFRILDPVDELAYLALECEFAGAGFVGDIILDMYRERCANDAPAWLVRFYKARRATLRARLSIWHLKDHTTERQKWIDKTQRYLELAEKYSAEPNGDT